MPLCDGSQLLQRSSLGAGTAAVPSQICSFLLSELVYGLIGLYRENSQKLGTHGWFVLKIYIYINMYKEMFNFYPSTWKPLKGAYVWLNRKQRWVPTELLKPQLYIRFLSSRAV